MHPSASVLRMSHQAMRRRVEADVRCKPWGQRRPRPRRTDFSCQPYAGQEIRRRPGEIQVRMVRRGGLSHTQSRGRRQKSGRAGASTRTAGCARWVRTSEALWARMRRVCPWHKQSLVFIASCTLMPVAGCEWAIARGHRCGSSELLHPDSADLFLLRHGACAHMLPRHGFRTITSASTQWC